MLDGNGDLAIAELVFWVPATVISLLVSYRHGFKRQLGWILVTVIGVIRIAGSACTIAEEQETTVNTSLITAAAILSSIGLSFLISILVGLLTRVHENWQNMTQRIPPRVLRLLQLLLLVGVILGIVGGTKQGHYMDPDEVSRGRTYSRVSTILFTIGFVLVGAGLAFTLANLRHVIPAERKLVYACIACYPFLFVRLLFSLISVFAQTKTFNSFHPNVWVKGFMSAAMEFIVAIIIITVGLITPVVEPKQDVYGEHPGELQARPWPGQAQPLPVDRPKNNFNSYQSV